jgi:hypothetical protein
MCLQTITVLQGCMLFYMGVKPGTLSLAAFEEATSNRRLEKTVY